jgi:hypothetical protein
MDLYIVARKTPTCWVFDHEHQNTVDEALCNGTEFAIDWYYQVIMKETPSVGDKLAFYLSTEKFKDAITQINLIESDDVGSYYKDELSGMTIWLCPWLQGYFGEVPQRIYVECMPPEKSISEEELDELMSMI